MKRMRWSRDQSQLLVKMREQQPYIRWESFAQFFPAFKPNQVRRHYYALVKASGDNRDKKHAKKCTKNGYQGSAYGEERNDKLQVLANLKKKLANLEHLLEESHSKVNEYLSQMKDE